MEPEVPDNLYEPMPPVTYCKCAETWVSMDDVQKPASVQVSMRVKCPVCGYWTDAVPISQK